MRCFLNWSVLLLSLGPLSLSAATIAVNGSFEAPALANGSWSLFSTIPGWTLGSGPAIEIQNHVAGSPFAGNQFLELDSTGESSVFQDLATVAGSQYILSFAFSPRPGVAVNSMAVFWGGSLISTINASGAGLGDTNWAVYSFGVTAAGSTTRLQFSGLGPSDSMGEYVDAVSVDAVPEPSSIMLCFGGLMIAAAGYRKCLARRS